MNTTPGILKWYREHTRKFNGEKCTSVKPMGITEAAGALGVLKSDLMAWENGIADPTVTEGELMAEVYGWALACFLLPGPPRFVPYKSQYHIGVDCDFVGLACLTPLNPPSIPHTVIIDKNVHYVGIYSDISQEQPRAVIAITNQANNRAYVVPLKKITEIAIASGLDDIGW